VDLFAKWPKYRGSGAIRWNPRRRFDEHSLAELAFSFQAQGVLLVRTIEDDKYEVIAGARRLRAAKLAALEKVPVRVVEPSVAKTTVAWDIV
jgi:ParB family transcriptional regulator, chromosome partitioning protein